MERYTRSFLVRISDAELIHARQIASALDMSLSGLVRLLLDSASLGTVDNADAIVVIDRPTAIGLRMEMRRWGYHYNQAVHALNAIAYYLRLNEMDEYEVLEELDKVSCKIESMNDGVSLLREKTSEISAHPVLYL